MTQKRRRRPAAAPKITEPARTPLAYAIAGLLVGSVGVALPSFATAQAPSRDARARDELEEIIVAARRIESYRVDRGALKKLTEGLRDTPQSVTELSRELLDDRGALSLNDALNNVPGITLGAGEFSWQGNNPNIRGFNARDDMYLDGIRDFGSYPRDPFDLETVEVLLGPSSVLFGRGSTGGAVNQVSKQPMLEALTSISVNAGSDHTLRGTADIARPVALLGDAAGFRLNLLAHRSKVADRDVTASKRFGLAPSLAFGLGTRTQVTVSYLKEKSDDTPDYGLPWLNGEPAPVRRNNFYGFTSDYLKTDADIATVTLTNSVGDSANLDLQIRRAEYSRRSRLTEPLITETVTPATPLSDVSVYRNVFIGDSDEGLSTVQATFTADAQTGTLEHALVAGIELSRETSSPTFAFGIGAPETNLVNPTPGDPFAANNTDPRVTADTTGGTTAVYALDTLKINSAWQVVAGVRWDRFDTDYRAMRYAGPPTPFNAGDVSGPEAYAQVDRVVSYRTAFVYKPTAAKSFYVAGSTSFNPSAQSLSFLTSGRGLGVGNVSLDPEKNRSIEAGFKADLRDGGLSLTTALFEIEKTNARVPDPNNPGFNTLGGEQRIRGLSVDVAGMLAPRLQLSSGYTYLDSEVVKAAPGAEVGAPLANAPRHSLSFWADYQATARFDVGFGARYLSERLAQNTGAGKRVPAYSSFDAMARYRLSPTLNVKLNLANLTNVYYFDQLHPWHVVPAPGFTATFAVNVTY